jgi:hypothetical protein
VQGTVFLGVVIGSKEYQHHQPFLLSRLINNQPSGAYGQYRADHGPAPCSERGSFELPSSIRKIFQHRSQNFRLSFLHRFVPHGHRGVQKTIFAGNAVISTILGLRVINQSCYPLVLAGYLTAVEMVQSFVVHLSEIPSLNLWLSLSLDSFVVGTVRAQRLSRSRCPATACNGAG